MGIVDQSSVQNYGVKFRIYRYRIVDLSSIQKYGVKFRIYLMILDVGYLIYPLLRSME